MHKKHTHTHTRTYTHAHTLMQKETPNPDTTVSKIQTTDETSNKTSDAVQSV